MGWASLSLLGGEGQSQAGRRWRWALGSMAQIRAWRAWRGGLRPWLLRWHGMAAVWVPAPTWDGARVRARSGPGPRARSEESQCAPDKGAECRARWDEIRALQRERRGPIQETGGPHWPAPADACKEQPGEPTAQPVACEAVESPSFWPSCLSLLPSEPFVRAAPAPTTHRHPLARPAVASNSSSAIPTNDGISRKLCKALNRLPRCRAETCVDMCPAENRRRRMG